MSSAQGGCGRPAAARRVAAVAALLLAGSLAACAPADTGFERAAARQLQARVLGVSAAAAGNDPSGGLAALDGLEADLATAVGNGQVSEDRRRTIMTAAAAVRADLAALAALKATADADADAAAAAAAEAAVTPASEATATPHPAAAKGNEGKAKGKD